MDRSLICLISGNKYVFAADYFNKKVEEYGDVDTLRKYFVTKKVKSLIARGYDVQEIRNILNIDDRELPTSSSQEVKDIINYHNVRQDGTQKRTSMNFATHKSDPEVSVFINNIKDITI